ncbi:zinc finger CCHC domain-containing protein 14 [Arapaima gigas]
MANEIPCSETQGLCVKSQSTGADGFLSFLDNSSHHCSNFERKWFQVVTGETCRRRRDRSCWKGAAVARPSAVILLQASEVRGPRELTEARASDSHLWRRQAPREAAAAAFISARGDKEAPSRAAAPRRRRPQRSSKPPGQREKEDEEKLGMEREWDRKWGEGVRVLRCGFGESITHTAHPLSSIRPRSIRREAAHTASTPHPGNRRRFEVKQHHSKLTQVFPDDGLEKLSSPPTSLDSALQPDPRCLTKLPQHLLKHDQVRQFFSSSPAVQFVPASNFACSLQYRGASSLPRPVCGVASIQPVISGQCSVQPHSPVAFSSSGAVPVLGDCSTPLNPPPLNPAPQASSEQNGILDWLRKLRLHKYYPVFKQLTMEKFLALTEEDLNKYDLTQGAKKKLKTQLELQNREKSEKRYLMSQFPVSCSGVARVTPSSHVGPTAPVHTAKNTELRVEVEGSSHTLPRDSGSSSGYSSSPSSPMAPRDESFERAAKDPRRRVEPGSESGDRDRPCVTLNNSGPTGSCRPTAQVLPVQNEPSSSSSTYHLPTPVLPLLSPGRILGAPRKTRPPPPPPGPPILSALSSDDRAKSLCSGVAVGVQLDSRFPSLSAEMPPGLMQDTSSSTSSSAPQGAVTALRSPPGFMVETSTAPTATSNTLHHVSRPPLHPQLSPSAPPASPHRVGHFSSSWSAFPLVSSVPMATVPENTYCVKSNSVAPPLSSLTVVAGHSSAAPSSSSPVSTEMGLGGAGAQPSVCVCSSCGCSGNCGSYSGLAANYAGYFQHPFSGPSVFTLGPLLHLSPLMTGPQPQPHNASAAPFSYPLTAPPLYSSSLPHEAQPGLVLPPMQGYLGAGAGIYQAQGVMGNGGTEHKKTGSVSCYNCGVSGHWAQDCKQPPMDSAQQGTFRLKYAPPSDSQDAAD